MSDFFITSDLHLGHDNAIKYCNRPFRDGEHQNESLIRNWKERVRDTDTVYHLGDFCFRGGAEGGLTKAQVWESQLTGKIIHIMGNHDKNNSVKGIITHAISEFANMTFLMCHRPPMMKPEVPEFCDFVLCGHVHNLWKYQYDPNGEINVPIINVGVDVWNYRPIKLHEIIVFYNQIMKGKVK